MAEEKGRRETRELCRGIDADFPSRETAFEGDDAWFFREQRMVFAHTDIDPRVKFRPTLPNQNVASFDKFA